MGDGRQERRRMPWAAAAVVVACLVGQPALADEGLATGATSRYVLDPKATTVEATRHHRPAQRHARPGRASTTSTTPSACPSRPGAENVRARSGGASLPVSLRATEDPSTKLARISFPNLLYGRSRTIVLTFDVPGEKPRSKDSTRVGPGLRDLRRLRRRGCRPQHGRGRRALVDDVRRDERRLHLGGEGLDDDAHDVDDAIPRAVLGRGLPARPRAGRREAHRRRRASPCCSTGSRTTRGGPTSWRSRSPSAFPALEKLVGDAVARRPRADPRGRLALAARLRRLVRPERRRDRHRGTVRRRPDLPRAVPRLGLGRAVRRALGVRGPRAGARRADGARHRGRPREAPDRHPPVRRGGRPQRLGRKRGQPLGGRRRLRLPRRLCRHPGAPRRPRGRGARRLGGRRPARRAGLRSRRHQGLRRRPHDVVALDRPPGDPRRRHGRAGGLQPVGADHRAEGPARSPQGGPRGIRHDRRGRRRVAPPGGPARRDDRLGLRARRLRARARSRASTRRRGRCRMPPRPPVSTSPPPSGRRTRRRSRTSSTPRWPPPCPRPRPRCRRWPGRAGRRR